MIVIVCVAERPEVTKTFHMMIYAHYKTTDRLNAMTREARHHPDSSRPVLLFSHLTFVSQSHRLTWPKSADRETEPLYLIQKPANPKATSSSLSKPKAPRLLRHRNLYASNTQLMQSFLRAVNTLHPPIKAQSSF